jgi:hypothetical protein
MFTRVGQGFTLVALTLLVAACGSDPPPAQTQTPPPAAPPPAAKPAPPATRVFFISPKNGETITSLAKLQFGSENISIGIVPKEPPTEAQVRPNTGHYHVAVDADCLPPNTVIPKADPWVHFGGGQDVIEMQMKPGPHKLALQMGDDLHRTIPGLCEVISVTVK